MGNSWEFFDERSGTADYVLKEKRFAVSVLAQ